MVNRISFIILILIAIIWFIIILPYFCIQTSWGSRCTSHLLSSYLNDYDISVERISHSITHPNEITLENITIKNKSDTNLYLNAKKLVIGLKTNNLLQLRDFKYLIFIDGELNLIPSSPNITADIVQLKNISLHYHDIENEKDFDLINVYGGIKPWSNQVITQRLNSEFKFTVNKAIYDQFNIHSLFLQGKINDQQIELTNFGGKINNGFFTTNAKILPDNSLRINRLTLNNLNFLSSIDLNDFNELFSILPKTSIKQLLILGSNFSIPHFSIENGNLELENIKFENQWQLQTTDLSFSAENIVWNDLTIDHPLLQWHNENNTIVIDQVLASWQKGNFKASGSWLNNQLTINNMIISGIRYSLPNDWYHELISVKFPKNILSDIKIKQFMLMPSLIIDTNPDLPFEFTSFEAFGQDIALHIDQKEWSVNGNITVKADNGMLNTIKLRQPDLTMALFPRKNQLTFSTLIDKGILEGKAVFTNSNQIETLTLDAHTVNSEILPLWQLINNPIKSENFILQLQGSLMPPTFNGIWQSDKTQYSIIKNQVMQY